MVSVPRRLCGSSVLALAVLMEACGGGGGNGAGGTAPVPGFSISVSPTSISLKQGETQSVQVSVTAQNGFSNTVSVSGVSLPAGVTVSPAPLSVTPGTPGTLTFSASRSTATGQESITIEGVSGTSKSDSALSLTVQTPAVFFPYSSVGGYLVHAFYDQGRQLLFAGNPELNELDVISTADLSVKARVPLPSAWGIDQMADSKTLVVGTAAQYIYTVDEDTLAVTSHPLTTPPEQYSLFFPNLISMANGKVILIGQEQGIDSSNILDGGQFLFEWNSSDGTLKQIEPTRSSVQWETDSLARSADHKWAIFSGDQFYLYSSDSDTLTATSVETVEPGQSVYGIVTYAINADGSKIAVLSGSQVTFTDRSFHVLGTVAIPRGVQHSGRAEFSPDGSRLFVFYGESTGGTGVETIDVNGLTLLGYYSAQIPRQSTDFSFLEVDGNGRLYFGADSGVRIVDTASSSPLPIDANGNSPVASCLPPNPFYFPVNSAQQVSFQGNSGLISGTKVYIDGNPATLASINGASYPNQMDIPASYTSGTADMECIGPSGDTGALPAAFSYGVTPVASSATLMPPVGTPTISLFGFGIVDSPFGSSPSVTVDGKTATVGTTKPNEYIGSLQGITVKIPQGTANQNAGVTVTNANGTGTLSGAFTYIPSATVVPASGILQLLFDSHRNLLYALKSKEVDVLDPATLTWKAPLQLPASVTALNLVDMALSPDGTKLAIAAADPHLAVVDPDNPSQAALITCAGNTLGQGTSISITASNMAMDTGPCGGVIDLAGQSQVHGAFNIMLIRGSADGTHMYGADLNISSGEVFSIDPATYAIQTQSYGEMFWTDLAVSPDGSQFAAVLDPPGTAGDAIGFHDSSLHYVNSNVYPPFSPPTGSGVLGSIYSPQGKVLVVPLTDSIEFWDTAQGTLRARLMTPENLNSYAFPELSLASQIALDTTGQTIYVISVSGVTVLKLPTAMDDMPTQVWAPVVPSTIPVRRVRVAARPLAK